MSLRISSDRDDRIGKNQNLKKSLGFKQNPQKSLDQNLTPQKSHAKFTSHKNFQRNYAAGIRENYHKSSDSFKYPKKSLLKSSYPIQKLLAKLFLPKKSRNRKFQTARKILRSSLSLEIQSIAYGKFVDCIFFTQ